MQAIIVQLNMRFLLKTNQITLNKHIERLPYERHETSIQGVHSNE